MVGLRRTILLFAAAGAVSAAPAQGASPPGRFNARAADQIAALQRVKQTLSPAERKLAGGLVLRLRLRSRGKLGAAVPHLHTGVRVSKAGLVEVAIRSSSAGPTLAKRLLRVGAAVRHVSSRYDTIRAAVPLAALTRVAAWREVRRIDEPPGWLTASMRPPRRAGKAVRAARIARRVRAAVAAPAAGPQGSVVSEGDKTHAAAAARADTGVKGTGVKLCALSDGVDSLSASQASGDLPADVDVLPGQEGSGDEGTAMLEILHDLAPGAALGFATAVLDEESFAENIRALRFDAGCDVIVDDIIYYDEPAFQDGIVAQAVAAVVADGAIYFSSAGNEGNVVDRTAGNYEGKYRSSGIRVGKTIGFAHDFDPGPKKQVYEPISNENLGYPAILQWADPWGAARDDYDLYELDGEGNVLAASQDVQNGDDDPFEIFGTVGNSSRLAVVKFRGADHTLQLTLFRGRFEAHDGLKAFVSPGVTRGHSTIPGAFSVGAAPAADPLSFDLETGDPPNPSGPFPNPFTARQKLERFTSDGPRQMFFQPDGTLVDGGFVRLKPDIAAADGVATSLEDFDPFFGTSAAAPHAAAIAGLVKSGVPDATEEDVRQAFDATALDVGAPGWDNRAGAGLVMADGTLAYAGARAQPRVRLGTPTVKPTSGDGDKYLEPGETGTLSVPVVDFGDGAAHSLGVRLVSDSPAATITPVARSYGDLASGATATRDFMITLAANYPLGRPVGLNARITFLGDLSPTTDTAPVATGQPSGQAKTFAYSGPPRHIPDFSAVGATAPIHVSGVGYASSLTFSIDGTRCTTDEGATTVGIDHTFVSDLTGVLKAPDGTSATLFQRDGSDGVNLCKVVFDDAATTPFSSATDDDAPFTGRWKPLQSLSALLLKPVDGTWTLKVTDDAAVDTGSIRAVSLHIKGYVR
jgi:subtilisin-like proprotein convertase family protein